MRTRALKWTALAFVVLCVPAALQGAPVTGGTGPGGFELTNGATPLEAWLDASDSSTLFQDAGITPANNGDPVYRWSDRSGNANHAQATNTTDRRPASNTTGLSNHPTIRFDPTATADAMNITGLSLGGPAYTVFILDQYYGGTQGRTLQSNTQNWLMGKWGGQNAFHLNGSWVSNPGTNPAGINAPTIGAGTVTGVSGQTSYFINAVDRTDSSTPTGAPAALSLGAAGAFPGEVSNADVSEIIAYSRALNTAERRVVENYLSAKYNVGTTTVAIVNQTLGANDLYDGDLASNGDFDLDVFGIGRSSVGNELTNAGSAGFGMEQISLADGDFALAGHASGSNGTTTSDMTGGVRWERSWYIDTTNLASADLAFDWNDAGVTAAFDPSFNGLYYRSINSGLFTLLAVGTVDGINQRVDFSSVALEDGYYTLGSVPVPEPATLSLCGLGGIALAVKARRRRGGAAAA